MSAVHQVLAGSANSFSFIASQAYASTTPTLSSLGALTGDLAVVFSRFVGNPTSGSAALWTSVSTVTNTGLYFRVLTAADISAAVSCSSPFVFVIYRGARSIASMVADTSQQPSGVSLGGFAKTASHIALFGVTCRDNTVSGSSSYATISGPATWTERGSLENGNARIRFYDRLPPIEFYADNASFTWNPAAVGGAGPEACSGTVYIGEIRASP